MLACVIRDGGASGECILEAILLRGGHEPLDVVAQACRDLIAQLASGADVLPDCTAQRRIELHGIGNVGARYLLTGSFELGQQHARLRRSDRSSSAAGTRADDKDHADDRGGDGSRHAENLATASRVSPTVVRAARRSQR